MDGTVTLEGAAASILTRAVLLDKEKRYTEALVCYQEGLQILLEVMKLLQQGPKRDSIKKKVEEYMGRAEQIKKIVNEKKESGDYHEQIKIEENSKGHSYEDIMGRFLDSNVVSVQVEDPYIKNYNQFLNLTILCELLIKKCKNLKHITLLTVKHTETEQSVWLERLQNDLRDNYNISMDLNFSTTLHDRQIILSNGWIIKIGRGLDYFKPMEKGLCIGSGDKHFRLCRETTVDIFHSKKSVTSNNALS